MPLNDKYRIQGPSNAIDLCCLPQSKSSISEGTSSQESEIKYYMNTGVLSQARGSAYVEYGKTKVMCGVFGPLEIIRRDQISMEGRLDVTLKVAPFSNHKRRECQPTPEDKLMTEIIREALEPVVVLSSFPKARFEIHLVVLQDDNGSALSACVTCAGLALVDAGVDMYDLIVGVHMRSTALSLASMPSLGQITMLLSTNQELSLEYYRSMINEAVEQCKKTADIVRHTLKTKYLEKEEEADVREGD